MIPGPDSAPLPGGVLRERHNLLDRIKSAPVVVPNATGAKQQRWLGRFLPSHSSFYALKIPCTLQ